MMMIPKELIVHNVKYYNKDKDIIDTKKLIQADHITLIEVLDNRTIKINKPMFPEHRQLQNEFLRQYMYQVEQFNNNEWALFDMDTGHVIKPSQVDNRIILLRLY